MLGQARAAWTGGVLGVLLACSGAQRKFADAPDAGAGGLADSPTAGTTQGGAVELGGAGADVRHTGGSGGDADSGCAKGYAECRSRCVDLETDANNCGECGLVCTSGMVCSSGTCECTAGRTDCYSECVDPDRDPTNCGTCGNYCDVGQSCVSGACQCQGGRTECGDACVDVSSDGDHCGRCGVACKNGQLCSQGECSDRCAAGETACGNSCVDLDASEEHCGECGVACAAGRSCLDGECSCPDGQRSCDGKCVDPTNDPNHCGACGVVCAGGQTCEDEQCSCPSGRELCDDQCVDLSQDINHCGECSVSCNGQQTCVRGDCVAGSGSGGAGTNGGATGEGGSGAASSGGAPTGGAPTGGAPTGGTTGECLTDDDCPSSEPYCSAEVCVVCRESDVDCVEGVPASCEGGVWLVGTPCAADTQVCSAGQCVCVDDTEPKTTLVQHPTLGCGQRWVDSSEPGYAWIVFAGTVPVHIDVSHGLAWTNAAGSADQAGAATSCASLARGGLTDWRLPTIDEGRALLAGCTGMSSGESCGLSSNCLALSCNDGSTCPTCQSGLGPHASGSYQHPACQLDGGFYRFHTSSSCSDCSTPSTWTVYAPNALFVTQATSTLQNPKCVHTAPAELL